MSTLIRPKLSYSNVIATISLFVALGGFAVAAGLPRHSVGARQLKRGAVTAAALRKGAVKAAKIAKGAVTVDKLGPGSVQTGAIADGMVTSTKLAPNAVTSSAIAGSAVGAGKLGGNAVITSKIANGAVTAAKLDDEVAPLLGTLRSGQTLRGVFNLGSTASAASDFVSNGITFAFPLATMPAATSVLAPGATTEACPGVTGVNLQTPIAAAGNLCVYVVAKTGEAGLLEVKNASRLGFGLRASASGSGKFEFAGFWAVTAS